MKGLNYVIIRPGVLTEKPSTGALEVRVSQGDVLTSPIGREDVASITVAALLSKRVSRATIECFGKGREERLEDGSFKGDGNRERERQRERERERERELVHDATR